MQIFFGPSPPDDFGYVLDELKRGFWVLATRNLLQALKPTLVGSGNGSALAVEDRLRSN